MPDLSPITTEEKETILKLYQLGLSLLATSPAKADKERAKKISRTNTFEKLIHKLNN